MAITKKAVFVLVFVLAGEFARRRLAELEAKGTLTNLFADVFQDGPLPKPLFGWQAKEQPGVFGAKDGLALF